MSKHTPGPWQFEFRRHASLAKGSHVNFLTDAEGYNIGLLSSWSDDPQTRLEADANARLIAQAPTLLQDLIDAAAQLRKYETLHRAKGTPDSLEKAEVNAALAARFEATIAAAVGGAE